MQSVKQFAFYISELVSTNSLFFVDQMDDTPIVSKEALETEENQALLKLLAHACQLEQEVRALDICKLMSSTTLQIAIKYASKNGRMQLANKISQMACQKQEEEERTQAGT